NRERSRRLPITAVLSEYRRIGAQMLGYGIDAMLVVRVVRQQLRYVTRARVLEIFEQPHQPPRAVSILGTNIGAGQIGCRLCLARVAEHTQLPEQGDGQDVRTSRDQKQGSPDLPSYGFLVLFHQSNTVAVNGV